MSEPTPKSKKKNHKLLFEVSVITLILFLVSMTVISIYSVRSSYNYYYRSKTDNLTRSLDMILNVTDEPVMFVWYIGYIKNNEIDTDYFLNYDNDDQKQAYGAIVRLSQDLPELKTSEDVNSYLTADEQKALACLYMKMLYQIIGYQMRDKDYHEIYMIDVSEKDFGYSYFETENDDIVRFVRENEMINRAISAGSDGVFGEPQFEMSWGDEKILTACKPLFENGSPRAVLILRYNCSDYLTRQMDTVKMMVVTGVISLLITDILLMLFLFRKAIMPLSAVKRAVVAYKTDKDSKKASAEMQKIKSRNELGVLADSFSEMTGELDSYMSENLRLTAERERVTAELELAAKIQKDMLPASFPKHSAFELYASMTPTKEVGGDFYDFFMIDEDHLCLVIADVSGKGMPAAMFMMKSKIIIKENVLLGGTPEQILAKVNDALCENNNNNMFVTVWLGVLEISTGKLSAASAGHEYPVIRHEGGDYQIFKDKHGMALGLFDGMTYPGYELDMKKGSVLFVYTDGVDEATDSDEKMFKSERLLEAMNSSGDVPPDKLLADIKKAVDDFVGDAPRFDDMTMLCIRIL